MIFFVLQSLYNLLSDTLKEKAKIANETAHAARMVFIFFLLDQNCPGQEGHFKINTTARIARLIKTPIPPY
jgi:hypothetical protein